MLVVTDPANGPLRAFADSEGVESAEIPPEVGGRFSVFSPAALLPAALLNIDIPRIMQGAANVRALCLEGAPGNDWAAQLGLAAAEQCLAGKGSLAFMPYCARLKYASEWFVQLWDESLGKNGRGQAVIPAMGPTDQHAQLQLFLEGPNDKLMLFARVAHQDNDLHLGDFDWQAFGAPYLKGRLLGDVIDAQWRGTAQACTQAGRANMTLMLPRFDAVVMGELLMGLQVATSVAAMHLGVNAYDQPAVERGKQISRKLLGG